MKEITDLLLRVLKWAVFLWFRDILSDVTAIIEINYISVKRDDNNNCVSPMRFLLFIV